MYVPLSQKGQRKARPRPNFSLCIYTLPVSRVQKAPSLSFCSNMISPIDPLDLGNGLTLSPRLKLLLIFHRSDPAVKPIDEWQIKLSLLSFLRSSPLSLSIPDENDLSIKKRPDLHKRKIEDPVAFGTLYVRDLGFLRKKRIRVWVEEESNDEDMILKRLLEWREDVLRKLGGVELNIQGVGFDMTAELPKEEDFEGMKRSWEDFYRKKP